METEKKKKGIWATIKESMNKTGGCCGGGDCGCGPSNETGSNPNEKEPIENQKAEKKSE